MLFFFFFVRLFYCRLIFRYLLQTFVFSIFNFVLTVCCRQGHCGRDLMVVEFTFAYPISDLQQVGEFLRLTERHDITEILLKVALSTITLTLTLVCCRLSSDFTVLLQTFVLFSEQVRYVIC